MTRPTYVWISGWQFRSAVFAPLQQRLPEADHHSLCYAQESGSLAYWLETQRDRIPQNAHLIGWSLGGMLAVLLAEQRPDVCSVLALCASVRFAGPAPAMAPEQAEAFRQRYRQHPESARRRFLQWVSESMPAQALGDLMLEGDQSNSLDWLYQIDLANSWVTCPVRAVLAEDDALINPAMARIWMSIGAHATLLPGAHDLPWRHPERLLQWVPSDE